MKIAICLYGIIYGPGGRTGSLRNFDHCWPNIKKMLFEPFIKNHHTIDTYISGYHIEDIDKKNYFETLVNAKKYIYSELKNSNPFTSKYASFQLLNNIDCDVIILTRLDLHWAKIIALENINFNKFNFLFPEYGNWNTPHQFTTDNFYMWPNKMTSYVEKAMKETYGWPRGFQYPDTHGLRVKLKQYIPEEQMHMISDIEEWSDVNSYFTSCRNGHPNRECMHPEVRERYIKENWNYRNH